MLVKSRVVFNSSVAFSLITPVVRPATSDDIVASVVLICSTSSTALVSMILT